MKKTEEMCLKVAQAATMTIKTIQTDAVPGLIDAILIATQMPPPFLLNDFLNIWNKECEENAGPMQPSDGFLKAILHLIKSTECGTNELKSVVQFICRPVLCASSSSSAAIAKISQFLANAVALKHAWDYAWDALAPWCETSILIILPGKRKSVVLNEAEKSHPRIEFGAPVACQLAANLLTAAADALSLNDANPMNVAAEEILTAKFCEKMASRFWLLTLRLLSQTLHAPQRGLAIETLLPSLLRLHKLQLSRKNRFSRLEDVWISCKCLFISGSHQRNDAYKTLTLLAEYGCLFPTSDGSIFDVRADSLFWEELRIGLVQEDSLTRKRALHILKLALKTLKPPEFQQNGLSTKLGESKLSMESSTIPSRRERWAEKEAASLGVQHSKPDGIGWWPCWEAFILLYEILDEYGIHLVEAAWNLQMKFLMENLTTGKAEETQNFIYLNLTWMTVLWGRGFSHGNPHVRRLIVRSFLEINWDSIRELRAHIPESFVLQSLLRALNDPVHHRDFGSKGIYSSDSTRRAEKFFSTYTASCERSFLLCFINRLAKATLSQSLCRPGLMAITSCIEAAAAAVIVHEDDTCPASNTAIDLLESLRLLVENCKSHFNSNYRAKVCAHVLKAARRLFIVSTVPVDKLAHFLIAFPEDLLLDGGDLCSELTDWIGGVIEQKWIVKGLHANLVTFLKPSLYNTCKFLLTDDDIESWRGETERWSRLLAIGVKNQQDQSNLLLLLEQHSIEMYQRVYISAATPEKIFLLLQSLLKECPTSSPSRKLSVHLVDVLHAIMGDLMSYAEKCATALWEFESSESIVLPPSVSSRLGGASQRRLPADAASAVLQAVVALETISECVLWCCRYQRTELEESTAKFFWKLSWKLLAPSNIQEELRAEFQLGAFEILVFVCKVLPLTNILLLSEIAAENGAISELVVGNFITDMLKSYDDVVSNSKLARSRQSVLTRCKWLCLDGLFGGKSIHSECETEWCMVPSTLSLVLQDAVQSLESASEHYMLPLFRCVRSLISYGVIDSSQQQKSLELMWELVKAGWSCIADCNKRRVAPLAAFLSAFLHPLIFGNLILHTEEAPLRWLICKLLEQGGRSPRTMRLTALHLTGLWLKYPSTIVYYIQEIASMCLHGGDGIDEELDAEVIDGEISAKEYSGLMQTSDPELLEAFSTTEMYVRVAVAIMIDKLAELSHTEGCEAVAAGNCGRNLLLHLLEAAAARDSDISKEVYRKNSPVHRKKVRAWQMLCILSQFIDEDMLLSVLPLLQLCIHKNNMPSVRQYIEMFAIRIYLQFPHLVTDHLVPSLCDCNMKLQALSSYVFIAANVLEHVAPIDVQQRMIHHLLPSILPHMTSHHHNLRAFTQVLIFRILERHSDVVMSKDGSTESKCFLSLSSYLAQNDDCTRMRSSVEGFLDNLQPSTISKPRGIFCDRSGDPKKAQEERGFECVPEAVVDQIANFLNGAREQLRESMAAEAAVLSSEMLTRGSENTDEYSLPTTHAAEYQKKIIPFGDYIDASVGGYVTSVLQDMENEDDLVLATLERRAKEMAKTRGSSQEIIVVASLVDRIPNLAGLVRTCEVFKVAALTIADKRVLDDKQFKMISVTAEQWVPIFEVREDGLSDYLNLKKREGYRVVGLEQTSNSTPINEYSFPSKAVLVLGREKEGIAVELLHAVDDCVEIPQLGVIRSLNVHVSAAIAVWEYTKQHI